MMGKHKRCLILRKLPQKEVEFAELKEKKNELTVNEIESQCAIMYARKSLSQTNFARNNTTTMTAGVINDDDDGFVDTKYGRIAVARRK